MMQTFGTIFATSMTLCIAVLGVLHLIAYAPALAHDDVVRVIPGVRRPPPSRSRKGARTTPQCGPSDTRRHKNNNFGPIISAIDSHSPDLRLS